MRPRSAPIVLLVVALASSATGCFHNDDEPEAAPAEQPSREEDEPATNEIEPVADEEPDEAEANDPNDTDQDGAIFDNCPGISNVSQSDIDGDGIGDHCDEHIALPEECGFGQETTEFSKAAMSTVSGRSGDDSETQTGCLSTTLLPLVLDESPNITVLVIEDNYAVVDLTPAELETIENSGVEVIEVASFPAIVTVGIIEARIALSPLTALQTVEIEYLDEVDPDVLALVPGQILAEQSDETLAAIAPGFWAQASEETIDEVGQERLLEIQPELIEVAPLQFELAPIYPLTVQDSTSTTTTNGEDG
jgi:hypothetical protein